jgi:hypothetical protein
VYVCMYVCMCVCMYVYICMFVFMYVRYVQGGSNMTGTDLCVNKPHKSRSYLNHFVYYALGIVPGDPLRSYCGHLQYLCPLYIIRASVRLNSVYSHRCHLVSFRGTPTWQCDRTDVSKVCIR